MAESLPARPNLDQLKHQAKDLLREWRAAIPGAPHPPRLRDAQRAIARRYDFPSWDALRAHVERITGVASAPPRRGMDYHDPIRDVVPLSGPLTRETVRQLVADGTRGVRVDASVPADDLAHLAAAHTVLRLDLSHRDDLVDAQLAFLAAMPQLTALSLAHCSGVGDGAVAHLRRHANLEQVNLRWTRTGDEAVAALAGKPQLARLILGGRLTDAGAARLREFPALAEVGATDSLLAVSTARALTDRALADMGALAGVVALDLHMSVFGSPHYTARGVAHLRGMTSLEELNFHGPLATDAVLREIAGIARLKHLHAQDVASGDEGFIALGQCASLEVLTVRQCPRITDRGMAAVARLPRLRSLSLGGPRLSADALAPLAGAMQLEDLNPIVAPDAAFRHIARIPQLARLTNMYNRSTTDAATRHLRGHPRLLDYSAFGTQISDESLRILSGLPLLETAAFENCAWITDDGLRALSRAPRLRRLTVWSCLRVDGAWTGAAPSSVTSESQPGPAGHPAGYRFETLIDYPELAIPPDAAAPRGVPPSDGLLSTLVAFGDAEFTAEGLRVSTPPDRNPVWAGVITPQAFAVPARIELEVRPLTELRLLLGRHNRPIVFDERDAVEDPAPWFLRLEAEQGQAVTPDDVPCRPVDAWARVTIETGPHERRLSIDGLLRHVWRDDDDGQRYRVGIGPRRTSVTIRSLRVE
jgi:hypothetical protein